MSFAIVSSGFVSASVSFHRWPRRVNPISPESPLRLITGVSGFAPMLLRSSAIQSIAVDSRLNFVRCMHAPRSAPKGRLQTQLCWNAAQMPRALAKRNSTTRCLTQKIFGTAAVGEGQPNRRQRTDFQIRFSESHQFSACGNQASRLVSWRRLIQRGHHELDSNFRACHSFE
jgi:hypothetical protein